MSSLLWLIKLPGLFCEKKKNSAMLTQNLPLQAPIKVFDVGEGQGCGVVCVSRCALKLYVKSSGCVFTSYLLSFVWYFIDVLFLGETRMNAYSSNIWNKDQSKHNSIKVQLGGPLGLFHLLAYRGTTFRCVDFSKTPISLQNVTSLWIMIS